MSLFEELGVYYFNIFIQWLLGQVLFKELWSQQLLKEQGLLYVKLTIFSTKFKNTYCFAIGGLSSDTLEYLIIVEAFYYCVLEFPFSH